MAWNNDSGSGDDNRRRNPWGSPPNPKGNDPRGSHNGPGRGGNNNDSPDLDELLRRAQQNFRDVLPGGGGPFRIGALVLIALALFYFASGFYFIQPNENAVVLTFGSYSRTDENAGLKYAMPWPFQNVIIVDVSTERRIQIGFRDGAQTRGQSGQNLNNESLMLTGDENIIDIDFVVLWRVSNAKDFLFEIRNPEDTIKIVAESAMREVIGRTPIQRALTDARSKVQSDTRALMQEILDEYKAGVAVNNIQLLKVDPPDQVVDAFNEVQRARQQKEELRNKAEAYRNDIIPRARGESEKLRQESEAYKSEVVNRATGDADRFNSIRTAYSQSPEVTSERMYLEAVEEVLKSAKTIVMGAGDGGQGILPYLSIDQIKRSPKAPAAESEAKPLQ